MPLVWLPYYCPIIKDFLDSGLEDPLMMEDEVGLQHRQQNWFRELQLRVIPRLLHYSLEGNG